MNPLLSVVILARDDRRHIAAALTDMHRGLSKRAESYEILVTDAGVTDGTMDIASRMATVLPGMRIASSAADARGAIRIFADADDMPTADRIASFLPYFEQGFHVVAFRPSGLFARPILAAISAYAADAVFSDMRERGTLTTDVGGAFRTEAIARAQAVGYRIKHLS